jgi:hypothetical protein
MKRKKIIIAFWLVALAALTGCQKSHPGRPTPLSSATAGDVGGQTATATATVVLAITPTATPTATSPPVREVTVLWVVTATPTATATPTPTATATPFSSSYEFPLEDGKALVEVSTRGPITITLIGPNGLLAVFVGGLVTPTPLASPTVGPSATATSLMEGIQAPYMGPTRTPDP